ncbi:TIGR03086 family metal-binding protein [Nonomuraea sp. NPDC050790]|uniref:TIGR03086 family metal-binding protein n=1 Tax=Nonomuraea sp. NPDC050790 TaxID=3364371 RepID=UPI0037B4D124
MLIEYDARAVRTSVALVDRAGVADLDRPTPCAGWTLRDLLAHMTAQHHGFAAAARGEEGLDAWRPRDLGEDPAAAYRAAAEHVLAAFSGAVAAEFPLPELGVVVPAARAIGFHFIDYVVHSWDVARTLGLTVDFEPELLEAALPVAEAVPGGRARTVPGASFAPAIAWTDGARLDRIVAMLGRSPVWPD